MEMELIANDMSEEDAYQVFDDNYNEQDISGYEEERCGLCMDVVVDRGVLDCCQHWFCFVCIDNWATITNLCPLCQIEFQLITCIPVYDTTGSSKAEEDSFARDEDWSVEGERSSLSFPSYYIDENAVVCLDGVGCKVRSGSTVGDDLNNDTSIACDSCDTWYHAFCVGFDPENTTDSTWFCPRYLAENSFSYICIRLYFFFYIILKLLFRCVVSDLPQGPGSTSGQRPNNEGSSANTNGESSVEAAFSKKVSVSVADVGETALVVSMVGNDQWFEEPKMNSFSTPEVDKAPKNDLFRLRLEAKSSYVENTKPQLEERELELPSLHGKSFPLSSSTIVLNVGDHVNGTKDHAAITMQQQRTSADVIVDDAIVVDVGITGVKRKHASCSSKDVFTPFEAEESKASIETECTKKVKTAGKIHAISCTNEVNQPDLDDSSKGIYQVAVNNEDKRRIKSKKKNDTSDIMSIIQGTDRVLAADKSSKEREAGLRVKKIMRRTASDQESSIIVQNLRKEIREAVRNKTSMDFGKKLFDPKLLAAFRTAVAAPVTEPAKKASQLIVKAKKSMLVKGKARESLTKKIYGINGRRKRAWDRDCEVEFWKHRSMITGKPERIETLKSVLDLLRNNSEDGEQQCEPQASNPILSRLYLADTSVFPRKDNIKPISSLKVAGTAEDQHIPVANNFSIKVGAPPFDNDKNGSVSSVKGNTASCKVSQNKSSGKLSVSDFKVNTQKTLPVKSDSSKSDKRKWALEVLARKTAVVGSNNTQEKHKDSAVLKGNYPLLAQLPVEMRPVLASTRHNKVPLSVRQAQLYRLAEHFLRKANQQVIGRTGDTELAVADAINIEKDLANRSNSKLVYMNLCSQELLRHSSSSNTGRDLDQESNSSPSPAVSTNISIDLDTEEALRTAGLLSDSPPNSPYNDSHGDESSKKIDESSDKISVPDEKKDDEDAGDPTKNTDEGHNNILEKDSLSEHDINSDFQYNIDGEDYKGASVSVSKLQLEEESSKMKVVLTTLSSENSSTAPSCENSENLGVDKPLKDLTSILKCSTTEGKTEESCRSLECLPSEGSEDPSLAEREELYGPEKEPKLELASFPLELDTKPPNELDKQIGETEAIAKGKASKSDETCASDQKMSPSEIGTEGSEANHAVAANDNDGIDGKNSASNFQTSDGIPKENKLSKDSSKGSGSASSISKKVEAYIKEHLRPLCKSGVITVEQYRFAVTKTTEKVMKFHSKDKSASFLIKEGEKVKKLAQQYLEAAQQKDKW